jgi:hypothetical protein
MARMALIAAAELISQLNALKLPNGISTGQHLASRVWATRNRQRIAWVQHFRRAAGTVRQPKQQVQLAQSATARRSFRAGNLQMTRRSYPSLHRSSDGWGPIVFPLQWKD